MDFWKSKTFESDSIKSFKIASGKFCVLTKSSDKKALIFCPVGALKKGHICKPVAIDNTNKLPQVSGVFFEEKMCYKTRTKVHKCHVPLAKQNIYQIF